MTELQVYIMIWELNWINPKRFESVCIFTVFSALYDLMNDDRIRQKVSLINELQHVNSVCVCVQVPSAVACKQCV